MVLGMGSLAENRFGRIYRASFGMETASGLSPPALPPKEAKHRSCARGRFGHNRRGITRGAVKLKINISGNKHLSVFGYGALPHRPTKGFPAFTAPVWRIALWKPSDANTWVLFWRYRFYESLTAPSNWIYLALVAR